MPTAGGPNTLGESNLVFAYDTGDTGNSYKGQPTVNVLPSSNALLTSYNDHGGTHITDTGFTLFGNATLRNISNPAQDWNGVYLTGLSSILTPGVTYTYSFYIYFTGDNTTISYFGYGAPGYTGVKGKWNRVSTTFTATTQDYFYVTLQYSNGQPVSTYYLANLQIEAKSYPTPFVNGTRSATQGLLPLIGNSTLDLTNMSFDSNAKMTFDGTNDYISCGTLSLNFSQGITAEVVANFTNTGTWQRLFDFGNGAGSNNILFARYSSTNYLWFEIYNGGSSVSINTAGGIINNQICHYVVTVNGSTAYVYRDGVLINSGTFATVPTTISRTNCYIGKSNWADSYFQGDIPIVKMYNRALTAQEIKQNYQQYKTRFNLS